MRCALALFLLAMLLPLQSMGREGDQPNSKATKEALQAFNHFIGEWKGTGVTKKGGQNFWIEKMDWAWKFKGKDAWLTVKFDKSKQFLTGELHYLPAKKRYQLNLVTKDKKNLVFEGEYKDKRLTVERQDPATRENQRLVLRLLHANRFLYSYQTQAQGKTLFQQEYQVGATKQGVDFAAGDGKPECIVSGGLGTMTVSYQGKTYYVCCSGCRAEFNENPEKYIKEFEAKKAKK